MLTIVETFAILEENLTTHFDNPESSESHFSRPFGKELHRCQDDFGWKMQWKYDIYTPMMVSRERIYQEYVNTKFQKARI